MKAYLAEDKNDRRIWAVFADHNAALDYANRMKAEFNVLIAIKERTLLYGQQAPGYHE